MTSAIANCNACNKELTSKNYRRFVCLPGSVLLCDPCKRKRDMREECKGEHRVIGTSCIDCGWELKIMNLYIPPGKKLGEGFEEELRPFLPEGTRIALITDSEVPTINEVGFRLDMHDKLYLTTQMVNGLLDGSP